VAATTGIIRVLNRDELSAVLAHEMAHVGNRDTLIMTVAAAIAGAISFLAMMARWSMTFGSFGRSRRGGGQGGMVGIVGLLAVAILLPLAAILVQAAISRAREYQAYSTVAKNCRNPWALANALEKLDQEANNKPMKVNKAVSHLFIENPLIGFTATMFSTHPPIEGAHQQAQRHAGVLVGRAQACTHTRRKLFQKYLWIPMESGLSPVLSVR